MVVRSGVAVVVGVIVLLCLFSTDQGYRLHQHQYQQVAPLYDAAKKTPQQDDGGDWITRIFKPFLPTPQDMGLTQFTSESRPENYPAVKDRLAALLPSDKGE